MLRFTEIFYIFRQECCYLYVYSSFISTYYLGSYVAKVPTVD
jgi:hypothetical protein